MTLLVDVANVVGSRPDGWWRDRAGATSRLLDRLALLDDEVVAVVEGRARESIFRDGRWWDELAMSVLESDWRRTREIEAEDDLEREALRAEAGVEPEAVGAASQTDASRQAEPPRPADGRDFIRRTVRRFS